MMQRALDAWHAAAPQAKERIRTIFAEAAGTALLDLRLPRRLTRVNNKLAIE